MHMPVSDDARYLDTNRQVQGRYAVLHSLSGRSDSKRVWRFQQKKEPGSGVGGFYNGWNGARPDMVSTGMPVYRQCAAVLFRRSANEVLGRSACHLHSVGAYLLYGLVSFESSPLGWLLWARWQWGAASDKVYSACGGAALLSLSSDWHCASLAGFCRSAAFAAAGTATKSVVENSTVVARGAAT
eukprot:2997983-Rhodomonas_salina.1